jgi:hypothetical protein
MEVQFSSFYISEDLLIGGTSDWRFPCDKHEKDDAKTPNIASFIIKCPEYFGSHVVCGPNDGSFLLFYLAAHILLPSVAESEVNQHDVKGLIRDKH